MKKNLVFILILILNYYCLMGQNQTGNLMGRVVDSASNYPLSNVNVIVKELETGVITNEKGQYHIYDIPVGSYTVSFQRIGFKPQLKTDVIIRSNRTTFSNGVLQRQSIQIEGIKTKVDYFAKTEEAKTSVINFSNEEIRRAPGSAGDVSRILLSLPSVAKVNDQSNNLIVRGGSPMENTFFIDNIEIPNINHFPKQGSSGGQIGILNVDFIEDVTFNTGGFSTLYGDKLSSIMEIKFRDGNPQEFDGQIDFNWIGFGGIFEGPINKKSSGMLAVKRSYLKYLIEAVDIGTSSAPEYGDIQGKFTYEFNPFHKISALVVFADDHNSPDQENAKENAMSHFGNQDLFQGTYGVNWRAVWNESTFSNTSLSMTSSIYDEEFRETYKEPASNIADIKNKSREIEGKFRNVNYKRLNDKLSIDFGLETKLLQSNYDNFLAESTNALGDTIPELIVDKNISAHKLGVFASLNYDLTANFSGTFGLRADYFSYNDNFSISPRFSCQYKLSGKTLLNASTGIYQQNLPLLLLSQNESFQKLETPFAVHYILGIEHLLTEDTRLVVEAYQKDYSNFPLDPQQPELFVIDEDYFQNYEELRDSGKALSRGIEITLQKKLAESIYGLVSATYFRSRYKGLAGVWRNRNYDNRFIASLEGGYKPSAGWEMSLRWIYAGGVPYTPIDKDLSDIYNQTVYDESKINTKRYPDYHSLNLRVDKRFYFNKTNLVVYFSVWNAYAQDNIAEYYWNDEKQKVDKIYQWTMLPILGLEWEF
ncbi:MAG: TonB-dependent receptor [Candidatus Cloacimonetes bacterium]|nr:TonB-dependent receptor [Candidatus Cloacimonadota bacterium]MCF7869344.1 TonB-dependent receptor [Candidatus Cloacimonadota bacterium]MCF7884739.1 TonB-dependent receptor [Candidatus Cloacimonadota bacterium]